MNISVNKKTISTNYLKFTTKLKPFSFNFYSTNTYTSIRDRKSQFTGIEHFQHLEHSQKIIGCSSLGQQNSE